MISSKLQLQVAIMLARDILVSRNGDLSRFERMCNGRGKSVLRRRDAINRVKEITMREGVRQYFPVTCRMLKRWVMV